MSKATLIQELRDQIEEAHVQAALAADAGEEVAEYEWRQEARALAGQLELETIERPFDAYADMYGDYDF